MTHQEIQNRLSERPEMCQVWESALPLEGDGGVIYLSSIVRGEESVGMVHVYIWDRKAKGKPEVGRLAAVNLMTLENLDRLIAEIDCTNHLALNYAKRVGFHEVGVVRQRKDAHGVARDVVFLDALPGDL